MPPLYVADISPTVSTPASKMLFRVPYSLRQRRIIGAGVVGSAREGWLGGRKHALLRRLP